MYSSRMNWILTFNRVQFIGIVVIITAFVILAIIKLTNHKQKNVKDTQHKQKIKQELEHLKTDIHEQKKIINTANDPAVIATARDRLTREKRRYCRQKHRLYANRFTIAIVGLLILVVVCLSIAWCEFLNYELRHGEFVVYEGDFSVQSSSSWRHWSYEVKFEQLENGEVKDIRLKISKDHPKDGPHTGRIVYTKWSRYVIWIEGDPIEEMPIIAH